jgi:trimeric autotransporter adhesin
MKTFRFFVAFTLICIALSPTARALLPPPAPDGGYPGGNTAEGTNALHDVNTAVGINNTAVGLNALTNDTTGAFNVAIGSGALQSNTTGFQNMAIGAEALANNIIGNFNMAIGFRALFTNTGFRNSAVGAAALLNNTTASDNTAIGSTAMRENTTGENNTAIGSTAMRENTTGGNDTAIGSGALSNNKTGGENTAVGFAALHKNVDGDFNTAVGFNALSENIGGIDNTAIGFGALVLDASGDSNTAVGSGALSLTAGESNTAIGAGALFENRAGGFNTAVGTDALSNCTGNGNIALGASAGSNVTTATNVICIGASGANVSGGVFIGNIYLNVQPIVGIDPDSVTITSSGRLGRGNVSSRRYKHDIQPMDRASEVLYALKPVSFRYNKEYDTTQTLAFGLIAEEVAEVYPDLVGRNPKGEAESVRYEQINAMLLNEFLKEHHKVEQMQKQIEALTAGLQKVSAQLEVSEAAPPNGSEQSVNSSLAGEVLGNNR